MRLFSKILSKLTLFIRKMQKCWCFYDFLAMLRMEYFFVCHKSHYLFWTKQGPFTQNFAKQPNIFLFPKFLELFFTPKNTPPKVKNSKPDNITIFLGHPVDIITLKTRLRLYLLHNFVGVQVDFTMNGNGLHAHS